MLPHSLILASELSEQDTIKGVQIRADAYVWRYVCRMPRICNVGGVRPQLFFVCASRFKRSNQWKRHGIKNVIKGTVRFVLSLVSSLLSSRRYYCSESKTIL